MVTEFVSVCDHVVACTHRVKHRAADPHLIAEIARSSGVAAEVIPDVQEAITRAISLAGREGIVLVVGSIFLVGEARERWYSSKS
jgi:dihydrofolate synthase/folylpolyglutamate synthase